MGSIYVNPDSNLEIQDHIQLYNQHDAPSISVEKSLGYQLTGKPFQELQQQQSHVGDYATNIQPQLQQQQPQLQQQQLQQQLLQQQQQLLQQQQPHIALLNAYNDFIKNKFQHQYYGNIETPKKPPFKYLQVPTLTALDRNRQQQLIQLEQQKQSEFLKYLNQLPLSSAISRIALQSNPQVLKNSLDPSINSLSRIDLQQPDFGDSGRFVQTLHCLPENSVCDVGHDNQCCGPSSFCIDYWGAGKCLAFNQLEQNDFTDESKKMSNLNYKSYYNYLLQMVKNEINANHYVTPLNTILQRALNS